MSRSGTWLSQTASARARDWMRPSSRVVEIVSALPMTATTVLMGTVAPDCTLISKSTPAAGKGDFSVDLVGGDLGTGVAIGAGGLLLVAIILVASGAATLPSPLPLSDLGFSIKCRRCRTAAPTLAAGCANVGGRWRPYGRTPLAAAESPCGGHLHPCTGMR